MAFASHMINVGGSVPTATTNTNVVQPVKVLVTANSTGVRFISYPRISITKPRSYPLGGG